MFDGVPRTVSSMPKVLGVDRGWSGLTTRVESSPFSKFCKCKLSIGTGLDLLDRDAPPLAVKADFKIFDTGRDVDDRFVLRESRVGTSMPLTTVLST